MGTPLFTPEFKEEAVRQITERGYSVAEVSDCLGVSAHSLYKWLRAIKPDNEAGLVHCETLPLSISDVKILVFSVRLISVQVCKDSLYSEATG